LHIQLTLDRFTLKTTMLPSDKGPGEHENALFQKWLSERRTKLKQAMTTAKSPGTPADSTPMPAN